MLDTKEVGFSDKYAAATALVASLKTTFVKTAADHAAADVLLDRAREYRKDLKADYDAHPIVVKAREIQAAKVKLDADLEAFVKGLKNGPMLAYEQAEERKRQAEEKRLAAIQQAAIDKENARLARIAEEQRAAAEKEAKRLSALAAKTRDAAKQEEAEFAAAEARDRAENAAREAQRLKDEAATAPKVTVVLEKTAPTATRRMVKNWRVRTRDGLSYTKADFAKRTIRLGINDLPGLPAAYFILNPIAVSSTVDGLGKAANLPGVEVWEDPA